MFRTCCPVEEILIDDGVALGVRLRDDSTWGAKKIWADKAVISATHIKPTFLDMVGPRHLDTGFMQRIKDLSLKGGSLYMTHFLTREELRLKKKYERKIPEELERYYGSFVAPFFPMDYGPLWMMVPTPQCNRDGFDAMDRDREKAKWDEHMRQSLAAVCENLGDDNLIPIFSDSPYDQEFRNTGVLGGSWYGIRCDRDQWRNERPLPELARYRTPSERLYLGHQSSAHPGGLCLILPQLPSEAHDPVRRMDLS